MASLTPGDFLPVSPFASEVSRANSFCHIDPSHVTHGNVRLAIYPQASTWASAKAGPAGGRRQEIDNKLQREHHLGSLLQLPKATRIVRAHTRSPLRLPIGAEVL